MISDFLFFIILRIFPIAIFFKERSPPLYENNGQIFGINESALHIFYFAMPPSNVNLNSGMKYLSPSFSFKWVQESIIFHVNSIQFFMYRQQISQVRSNFLKGVKVQLRRLMILILCLKDFLLLE